MEETLNLRLVKNSTYTVIGKVFGEIRGWH
jgi:hypothetical protein